MKLTTLSIMLMTMITKSKKTISMFNFSLMIMFTMMALMINFKVKLIIMMSLMLMISSMMTLLNMIMINPNMFNFKNKTIYSVMFMCINPMINTNQIKENLKTLDSKNMSINKLIIISNNITMMFYIANKISNKKMKMKKM